MYHILYTQADETLSFTTSDMFQFYQGSDDIPDVITTHKGVGRYNSCTHIKNVKIVPSMYAQTLGMTIKREASGFTVRNQLERSGYIVSATLTLREERMYVHAVATVFGPYWDRNISGWLSPICIILSDVWPAGALDLAIEDIVAYLDKVIAIEPRPDARQLVNAIECDHIVSRQYGYMFGSLSQKAISPWHVDMKEVNLTSVIEHTLRTAIASYDDAPLLNQALESYRLDLGVTKELVDTATGLAAVKSVADVAKALLPDSPRKFKKFKTLREYAKYLAGTKLWYEYGCKLPFQTIKTWSTALKPQEIAKYCLAPGELRSGVKHITYNGNMLTDPENTVQITMDTRLGLGLKPQSETVEFINALYKYGVLMSLADGWDLIPLSFAINWVTTLPQQFAEKLSNFADYWRFSYSYAKRTWQGHVVYTGPYTVSFDFYIRNYSKDIPKMTLTKQLHLINDEGICGNLSLSSLDEAVSLLTLLS
jgi:hypothetical protein